ncbi:serine/threonine-protein kinase [Streptomyces erythrochromogenes]|uniref:serine/threonine-protein kinase n=1 Tax=Streptomyces erythrochromogenes TaxID=285574 RepID=UPI0036998345
MGRLRARPRRAEGATRPGDQRRSIPCVQAVRARRGPRRAGASPGPRHRDRPLRIRLSSAISPLLAGDPLQVASYRLVGRLGSGGMGTVYAALDARDRRVAVKVVHPQFAADPQFRARFHREVGVVRRVCGPCLVPFVDADAAADVPWLVTGYVPGPTLHEHLAAHGRLTGIPLHLFASGAAAALAAVHAAGVVHRDLKPANVILSPDGPRVLDFGIAHVTDGTAVTRTGATPVLLRAGSARSSTGVAPRTVRGTCSPGARSSPTRRPAAPCSEREPRTRSPTGCCARNPSGRSTAGAPGSGRVLPGQRARPAPRGERPRGGHVRPARQRGHPTPPRHPRAPAGGARSDRHPVARTRLRRPRLGHGFPASAGGARDLVAARGTRRGRGGRRRPRCSAPHRAPPGRLPPAAGGRLRAVTAPGPGRCGSLRRPAVERCRGAPRVSGRAGHGADPERRRPAADPHRSPHHRSVGRRRQRPRPGDRGHGGRLRIVLEQLDQDPAHGRLALHRRQHRPRPLLRPGRRPGAPRTALHGGRPEPHAAPDPHRNAPRQQLPHPRRPRPDTLDHRAGQRQDVHVRRRCHGYPGRPTPQLRLRGRRKRVRRSGSGPRPLDRRLQGRGSGHERVAVRAVHQ